MFITVTIKMEAQSQGELIDTFGGQVRQCRTHFDGLRDAGAFGPPNNVEMRYLVIGGKWRESESTVEAEQEPSTEAD